MTRYRGGTYSHTVDRIVFTDGSSARTDLIRLNPNLQGYSLDFTALAPFNPSRYRLDTWSALPHLRARACEAEVDWILRHSFPMLTTTELSRRLREAGYPLGPANISEHEAIAGTQAAIWHLTNELDLDNRPLNVPIAVHRAPGPMITFEFDGEPQLGGYSITVTSDTPVTFTLQKSANSSVWQDISGSRLTVTAGSARHHRTLGVGSTLSASSFGRAGRGYRYYRLAATTEGGTPTVDQVCFWLTDTRHYRNADRVVHLYDYLLAGARRVHCDTVRPSVLDANAVIESGLVGPFRVAMPLALVAGEGHILADADDRTLNGVIEPDTDFYLRPPSGASAATLTAKVPGMPHEFGGRVLTAVARDEAAQRLTPVALSVRADVAIHFDISWDADNAWADTVGEGK
jgi:TQXA domain-containing protein